FSNTGNVNCNFKWFGEANSFITDLLVSRMVSCDMQNKTENFFQQVFEIARLVPKGRVTTYSAIAKALGTAKSARLVGTAMNHSHDPDLKIPAHRVVNSKGLLTGKFHFAYPEQM